MTATDTTEPATDLDPDEFGFSRTAWVPAPAAAVYELVSDVATVELWSPTASAVRYDDGAGPTHGAWFGGHNRRGEREWDSRSQVLVADAPAEFSFVVGGLDEGSVRWRWLIRDDGPGSIVTQEWQLLRMDPVFGATRRDVLALQREMAASVETTLVRLSRWAQEQHMARTVATG
jgi:hypothetical protein